MIIIMGHQFANDANEEEYYNNKTILGLTLLYNKNYHGDFLSSYIETNYILQEPLTISEFLSYNNEEYSSDYDDYSSDYDDVSWINDFEEYYKENIDSTYKANIDILYVIMGPNNEYLTIIKTFWLRIIQRTWKKIYKLRKQQISKLSKTILKREIKNKIIKIPKLKGMLNSMK